MECREDWSASGAPFVSNRSADVTCSWLTLKKRRGHQRKTMSLISRILARVAKLPPAETYDIAVEKNLHVPMPDGVVLLADHYYPRHARNLPTLLVRTP